MSETNGFASRDQLLAPAKRRYTTVEIPCLGTVRIRSLHERERSKYEADQLNSKGRLRADRLVEIKCRLVVLAVVDADGNQLFTDDDIPRLLEQDSLVINRLADAIREHCGITDEDLEELEKNYGAMAVDDSP